MSTDAPARRDTRTKRRGRAFAKGFALAVGALAVVGALGAAAGVAQGPRVTDVQIDPAAAIGASGSRLILTTTQALREVEPGQVTVEPATPFTVDTSGRNVGLRFTLPLLDDTDYSVTVRDVAGLGAGPPATLAYDFRTPPLSVYLLQRGDDIDTVFRTDLSGENGVAVYTHPHIEDFRATASHLVMSVRTDHDDAALVVTDPDGGAARELPLPGDGFVTNLQTADRGETIGYTFSDADLGADGGLEAALFTASLADGAAETPPTQVALSGGDSRVAEWRFVPDSDSILVLAFDSRLLLAAADGSDPAPLGSALGIDGIARGSSLAAVERLEGMRVVDLTDGSETELGEPVESLGSLGDVTPVPGEAGGTVRTYAALEGGAILGATTVAHVADDGAATVLWEAGRADAVIQTCVSPSGRYAAILLAPDAATNPYDQYLLPVPERLQTQIVEVATGTVVVGLEGFGLSWCQVPAA